ncbi:MAG TPA: glycosyltransferase family A protein [Paludibacteraceae bacterium]|nr:glycosyltransferase family A protein [Paludibacteraceae bacterium]HPT42215.1 glycosyltransferase family A protein [Paludibacteraceae bacterium]
MVNIKPANDIHKASESENFPLVSVIIPVYNSELYLAETLESVLISTYPNFEVIIMDDGSTDKSMEIAQNHALQDARIRCFVQPNAGASVARNHAIGLSHGKYILPVDSDDTISNNYIEEAVKVLENKPEVKVVSREASFFGEKTGRWNFPPFSYNLLARRNLIDVCSMYRKADWDKTGGYCEEITGREDWDFWISLFKTGGEFVRLPINGLNYRIRSGSKRVKTRNLKKELIDMLNIRHKAFFYRELKGKLHYQRTHSRKLNIIRHFFLPENIFVNPEYSVYENAVYLSNEEISIRNNQITKLFPSVAEKIKITEFTEKRYHIPGNGIKTSKARDMYRQTISDSYKFCLGYYEQQISGCTLKSFLIILEK